jgi:hypothetical protein
MFHVERIVITEMYRHASMSGKDLRVSTGGLSLSLQKLHRLS